MSIIVENVSFQSEGHELIGRIYRPNALGRFPAVSISHGYPCDNKLMDLAEELSRAEKAPVNMSDGEGLYVPRVVGD